MLKDLFVVFLRGPAAVVARDSFSQVLRAFVDLKRRLGLRLGVNDLARVLAALNAIEGSRRYLRGYEFIYAHLKARLSPLVTARLDRHGIFPPSAALIEVARNFEVGRLPRTVAFLEQVTRSASAAQDGDLRRQWEAALSEDGLAAYEHFNRSAWLQIYMVAFLGPRDFLLGAIASIPSVAPYLRATQDRGLRYYDVLADAPKLVRVMIYVADANREGHALRGASVPFPRSTSEYAERALDRYLEKALGGPSAKAHVLFSANREKAEREDPIDVQAALDRAGSAR